MSNLTITEAIQESAADPTGVQLRQYDDGRTVVVAGDKEYGLPFYNYDVSLLCKDSVFNSGQPVWQRITVRAVPSGELIVAFGTKIEAIS